jgi:hypothetical protein
MPATREELIARWETEEGKALAEAALQALRAPAGSKPGAILPLDAAFLHVGNTIKWLLRNFADHICGILRGRTFFTFVDFFEDRKTPNDHFSRPS